MKNLFWRKKPKLLKAVEDPAAIASEQSNESSGRVSPEVTSRVNKNCSSFVVDMNAMVAEFDKVQQLLLQNVEDAKSSTRSAEVAKERMNQSSAVVLKLQGLIDDLRRMTQHLDQVDGVMKDIEKNVSTIQTLGRRIELVSFNASIEAARAGKYGRGFAVVASEVQNLANQSASALTGIKEAVKNGRQVSAHVKDSVEHVVGTSQPIIDQTMVVFQEIVGDVSHMSEQALGLAESMTGQVDKIKEIGNNTKRKVEDFNRSTSDLIGDMCGVRIQHLSIAEVRPKVHEFTLIDVRRDTEWNDDVGHIEGATLITLSDDFDQKIASLDRNEIYLFVCRSGGRSARAAQIALSLGFQNVFNMEGGMLKWREFEVRKVA